jgi:hypothetical protein
VQHNVSEEISAGIRPEVAARLPRSYPLNTPLPKAPKMRIYCGYGHGVPTERAYHYRYDSSGLEPEQCPAAGLNSNPKIAMGQVCISVTSVAVGTAPREMSESTSREGSV